MQSMRSNTALHPFDPQLQTIHMADSGPEGIVSGVFQEQHNDTWVPVYHASWGALSCENKYS